MTAERPIHSLRVVVALTACRGDLASLELAARLAAQHGVEFHAVFIEEVNLLNVAELPFVKEIDRLVGTEQELDSARMALIHRASLSRIRRELSRIQEQRRIRGNLTTRRGHFLKTALDCCDDLDLLIMAHRRDSRVVAESSPRVRFDRATWREPRVHLTPIWCIFGRSPGSERALAAARDIAASEARPLVVAVPEGDLPTIQRLRAQADLQSGQAHTIDHRLEFISPFNGGTLVRRMRRIGCRLIVLGRSQTVFIEAASDLADWPLVLV